MHSCYLQRMQAPLYNEMLTQSLIHVFINRQKPQEGWVPHQVSVISIPYLVEIVPFGNNEFINGCRNLIKTNLSGS